VNVVYKVNQLFEFVCYSVGNFQDVNLDGRRTVSELLYSLRSNLYEALIALGLCSRTLWTHVRMLCQLFSDEKPIKFDGDLSEDVIKDALAKACEKSATSLGVAHECGETDLHNIVVNCLLSWSAANELLETSANPSLVKEWAKVVCEDSKDANAVDSVPVLYSLLSSKCKELPKRELHIILEQKLLTYEELEVQSPKLCRWLQIKLIDILLIDIYATEDNLLPRARIFVKKGQALRACGLDNLNSSFQCLSEALSLL
ncbi:hypothetical protein Taro_043448, partial [Colocasia esculenta]|nr:hypothetical protein [Colocasia esculenta]